jgi:dihydrofolate synthase/folylpolyglutamate synthase
LSLETRGIKLGLNRTKKLLSACNNPENSLKSIQIIGTNGKGTTAASISSILSQADLNVGLYTSPHLVSLNERIRINNKCISNKYINEFVEKYKKDIIENSATFFETLTVLALDFFKKNNVDIAILETGLGGEYDSVTASKPSLQIFTSISKDHMHILGRDIKDIATTKAHAMQNRIPCISLPQEPKVQQILDDIAKQKETCIDYNLGELADDYVLPLMGEHQKQNILLAIKASQRIYPSINKDIIKTGIKNISWPGRMQIINKHPLIIFDVAHNEQGLLAFWDTITDLSIQGKKTLVISLQKTKDINNVTSKLISLFDTIICTQLNDRMYSEIELMNIFTSSQNLKSTKNPSKMIGDIMSQASDEDLIAIIGSHYWGEEIEKIFKISLVST